MSLTPRIAITIVSIALVVSAACGGGDDSGGDDAAAAPSESATVVLKDIAYDPEEVSVFVGGTVTWEWDDGNTVHDVKGDDFKSELQDEGTFEHTFDEPGTYDYVCTVHPAMKGEVTVVEE